MGDYYEGTDDEDVYTMDYITAYNQIDNRDYYQVKWKGYSHAESTWEPVEHILAPSPAFRQRMKGLKDRWLRDNPSQVKRVTKHRDTESEYDDDGDGDDEDIPDLKLSTTTPKPKPKPKRKPRRSAPAAPANKRLKPSTTTPVAVKSKRVAVPPRLWRPPPLVKSNTERTTAPEEHHKRPPPTWGNGWLPAQKTKLLPSLNVLNQ